MHGFSLFVWPFSPCGQTSLFVHDTHKPASLATARSLILPSLRCTNTIPSSPRTPPHACSHHNAATTLRIQIFKEATLFFSSKTPNLVKVIHAMDHIDNTFTEQIRDEKLDSAIRSALTVGKKIHNHYYKLSDLSATYQIALSK